MYLGLDLSTQQLKGVIIDDNLRMHSETSVSFDKDLPHYKTKKGVFVRGKQVLSPVAMWIEALDLLMERMKDDDLPLDKIRGISGSGQQHGSIYWSSKADSIFESISDSKSLVDQFSPDAFSYELSPNWQDASTQAECDEIEASVDGPEELARITGSKAHHRFTGPQIMRLRKSAPEIYNKTSRISLVSSFLCSLFLGKIAPIDPSDICGGNFWDIKKETFVDKTLDCISGGNAAELRKKLGDVCMDGAAQLGSVSSYFQTKYGFAVDCQVMPFTGDNPATILALPLLERNAMISLGTSTTMLLSTPHYVTSPAYHMFAHPTTEGYHMAMLCYKNGSLAREYIRDSINQSTQQNNSENDDWEPFNNLATKAGPPSRTHPHRKLGFYFPLPEIIPQTEAGTWRFLIDSAGSPKLCDPEKDHEDGKKWNLPTDDARAILDSQFLDIRMRSQAFFNPECHDAVDISKQPSRTYVVGGASKNPAIADVLSQVLGSEEGVFRQLTGSSNACALGGANKAAWAILRKQGQTFEQFFTERWDESQWVEKIRDGYEAGTWEEYGHMLGAVKAAEDMIVSGKV